MNEETPPPPVPEVPQGPTDAIVPPNPSVETVAQQAVDRAEAAATRRRWVSLAELVGVAGLVIAALGLWMTWSDRRADVNAKQAERATEAKVRTLVMLKASGNGDKLTLSDAAHDVQSIDVTFPKALGIAALSDVDPKIEANWFSRALLDLTDGGPDKREGRLPVLIAAHYWDGDVERKDSAIYDVTWKTEGRFLAGRALKVEGLKLRERTGSAARLDAIWAAEKPKPAK
ncbi:hypothetical protein [Sphingomonas sp. GB1N7]|uniref:hypothetical protein n=1 Tax=Parasphingomonas caseinilytica TaxID=3096158 RepID=UPI002FC866A0